jgi:hypothetical protein
MALKSRSLLNPLNKKHSDPECITTLWLSVKVLVAALTLTATPSVPSLVTSPSLVKAAPDAANTALWYIVFK